jgi:hypothetical protein
LKGISFEYDKGGRDTSTILLEIITGIGILNKHEKKNFTPRVVFICLFVCLYFIF